MKILILITIVALYSCQDTVHFEKVRQIKTGMTEQEIESIMGEPSGYEHINDSSEVLSYTFDADGNGVDKYLHVTYNKGIAVDIFDSYY